MSPVQAARTALVCILVFGIQARAAERRPVAVIEMSDLVRGTQLARELGNILNNHEVLKPVDDPELPGELMGPFTDEDADRAATVRDRKATADDLLRRGEFARAAAAASEAQANLRQMQPTEANVATYAELAFIVGNARLGERNPNAAASAFRLAHSLDPKFRPNAALTFPEVLDAFDKAIAGTPKVGTIKIIGTGRIVIDGVDKGEAQWQRDVPAGEHVVWRVGPDHEPRAVQIVVEAGDKAAD